MITWRKHDIKETRQKISRARSAGNGSARVVHRHGSVVRGVANGRTVAPAARHSMSSRVPDAMLVQLEVCAVQPQGLVNPHPRHPRWPRINRCSVRIVQAPLCTWCQIGIGPTCGVSGSLMAAFQVCLISHGPRKPLRHAIVSARARLPTITRDHHACSVYDRSRVQNGVGTTRPDATRCS